MLNRRLITTIVLIGSWNLSGVISAHEPSPAEKALQLDEAAIGTVRFENSCSDEVQATFNRGIALLHSFWFSAAIDTFSEVLKHDPKCAMAEWGKAMAHWGNPLGNNRAKEQLKRGAEAVSRARKLPTGDTRERDYIDAVGLLYENYETTEDHPRAVAFEKAMEKLVERNPNDIEAAIFYAMALNGTADLTDKTYAQPLRAAKILESAFEAQPNHPGIAHYIIHSYDAPALAKHALPAAQQYASIAPAAPHALHMPSHTFTRLGHWQQSIETNLRSADAAMAAGSPGEALHAIDYMTYAYLQTGQDKAAAIALPRAAKIFDQLPPNDRYLVAGAYAAAAVPTRYALERGDWAAAIAVPNVQSPAPFVDAIVEFSHGIGAARSADIATASKAVANLKASEQKLEKNPYWAGRVEIQRTIVEAWLENARGNHTAAVTAMNKALELENASEKSAISPGPLAPAGEQLGELLLELGQAEEALAAFQTAVEKEPGRFRGLYGAAVAAQQTGNAALARQYFSRLVEICKDADGERPELVRAQAYLADL
ncbi:MAG: tetratricopeptide repeat protein [Gammaproteobacteria bacterium]